MTFPSALVLFHWRRNTRRSCFVRSIRAMMEGMTEWIGDPEKEMKGWDLGGRPDLLPVKTMNWMTTVDLWTSDMTSKKKCWRRLF